MRARFAPLCLLLALGACHKPSRPSAPSPDPQAPPTGLATTARAHHAIQTVFIILMENHDWSQIEGSPSAPYINGTLLPQASFARQYFNPPGLHPSEPNYLWLEGGQSFGVQDDREPAAHHFAAEHLTTLLDRAGISWKAYQEDIPGTGCPLRRVNRYVPKHNPFVYFDDVTEGNDPGSAKCVAHVRPYEELARDLQANTVAAYNFITHNACNDMHDPFGCPQADQVKNGDAWLAREVPRLMASQAYQRGGAIFITWDEGEGSDGPIGMIVLSPFAKGGGYSNRVPYTHSSTLRSLQEIFGVSPLLGDAANATDLADLFKRFP